MKTKKRFIVFKCVVFVLLIGAVCFLKFTMFGQNIIYDVFGGNDLYLKSGEKELYWFDVAHRNNSNSPIFKRIETALTKFNPDLILVEGGFDTFEGSRDEAIYNGESAFTAYLAKKNGIVVEDIEPPFIKQVEFLQSKYPPEDILAMYLIRQITSIKFQSDNSMWEFEKEVFSQTQFLINNGLDYSGGDLEEILNTVNTFMPEHIDGYNWRDVNVKTMNSVYADKNGTLYPIYNDVVNYRNTYLLGLISEKKDTYNRIFIVMGGGHIIETKENLIELYPR